MRVDAMFFVALGAVMLAMVTGTCLAWGFAVRWNRRKVHGRAQELVDVEGAEDLGDAHGIDGFALKYLMRLSRELDLGVSRRLFPPSSKGEPSWFAPLLKTSGLEGLIDFDSFREGRLRLCAVGGLAGALFGGVLSDVMMGVGCAVVAYLGFSLPKRALELRKQERAGALEKELPELFEVMALGMRSGLPFDRSFLLYSQHFETEFAQACAAAQSQWSLGLKTREQSLRELAACYESPGFKRVIETVIRSLRFGSPLAPELEQAAADARALRKAHRQEEVAKAPVKMMIPTGTLILPAMLLLVLGPVLLEMAGGFS